MTADVATATYYKRQRLQRLLEREAKEGIATPPEVLNEIDSLSRELSQAGIPMAASSFPFLIPDTRLPTLESTVEEQGKDIRELRSAITRLGWAALISAVAVAIGVINLLLILLLLTR